ncbi:uncharacterized protein NECHADRAFT_87451 [Fusarium vanettenii 77-13-4]|uniref:Uncharacterized protein n=1 Tax=Fusarium vanettenii (strain ATCC MYA-4622 / CBS 123669 / FGSC 9596 / NRRL 45880 / 77-13-4) TaxID=660122 RepID=C7ZE57_FUSV7|nr:uncharacterized protein NECHADRAFT_87451 [Fusarium vanettenii 77-13-4]EEU37573.1 hypothetical protein NECHADRAFT_87451 [Fusarium vanettenii 77-13-4]
MAKNQPPAIVRLPPAVKTASARRPVPCNNAVLSQPTMPKRPAAPTQRPVGLPEHPKIPQKHPSRPTLPPPNRPLPDLPRPSRLPTAQPTKKPVGYKPVPPPKATPRPSVVKKQPTPNKGMQMDDVKRIQQAAYARGQKDGRKTGQAKGYQAGDRHGRKVGQEAGNRQGFSKGQKQGYTQGHKSGHASGQTQGYAKGQATGQNQGYNAGRASGHFESRKQGSAQGQSQGFDAGQRRGHVSGHRQGYYYQGQHAGYSQGEHLGYHHGYQQRRDEEHGNNTTAVAGGVAAGAMLGGTFMYLGHEALDPDGLSQVTEETESISTEMEMSDDDFAPGEPVEDEDWYERHRAGWDSDEAYARPYEGVAGHRDEGFYEGGGYIGGYEGSDGYDTNQDVRDDSQVHLSQEYEANKGGFTRGEHSGSADDFHEKRRGEEDCRECDDCCGCGDSWFCVGGNNKKDNGGCAIIFPDNIFPPKG